MCPENNDLAPGVLYSQEMIARRVQGMGQVITRYYKSLPEVPEILALVVLKGAFIFAADLLRQIDYPMRIRFIEVKSYRGTQSTGKVEMVHQPEGTFRGEDVLIVEDIVDTGRTIRFLRNFVRSRQKIYTGPNDYGGSVRVAALLHKPAGGSTSAEVDFVGITVGDAFVCGYGLDLHDRRRNIPYVFDPGYCDAGRLK